MPVSARAVAKTIESIAPLESGVEGDELGFVYGNPDASITGVGCMWNAHSQSIQAAVDLKLNMLVVHEQVFYQPQLSPWYQGPLTSTDIVANAKRRTLLDRHDLVVYRSHSNWDALAVDGVPDQAVAALGYPGIKIHAAQKFFKVHELPASITGTELAERAKQTLNVPWTRVFGDRNRLIRRFAFLIGGFGENQIHMPQAAMEMGAECIIIGEMNEFVVIAALECGLFVIETVHSNSEIPAIKRQAGILQAHFPEISVRYIDSGALGFNFNS
jgi:putative NIF3 family GTP cyclohydrolase 1 type 2